MRKKSWTDEQLKEAAKDARSYREILRRLGLQMAGGNYNHVKRYIRDNNVEIVNLQGVGWNRNLKLPYKPKRALSEILTRDSTFQSFKLKKRLFLEGMKKQSCEECGWAKKSEDGRIPLELDHINGDPSDNRLENLRVLCPNCHSLKLTHRGRNKRKNK